MSQFLHTAARKWLDFWYEVLENIQTSYVGVNQYLKNILVMLVLFSSIVLLLGYVTIPAHVSHLARDFVHYFKYLHEMGHDFHRHKSDM